MAEIATLGTDGLVVRFSDRLDDRANRAALALATALRDATVPGIDEVSTALASVYVRAAAGAAEEVADTLSTMMAKTDFLSSDLPAGRRRWSVPATFGGNRAPGLADAAAQAGLDPDAAVADLTRAPLRVLAIGFAPGQPYLGTLPEAWDLPRLPDLIDVPAAALVVAIRQVVLFANASPTGWQHVGQTAFRCFRPDSDAPFPLRPGDEIAFRAVDEAEFRDIETDPDGGARCEDLQ